MFLPPYSPDLTPIELAFAKAKPFLEDNDELLHIVNDPIPIITAGFNTISTSDCTNWIEHCGHGE